MIMQYDGLLFSFCFHCDNGVQDIYIKRYKEKKREDKRFLFSSLRD